MGCNILLMSFHKAPKYLGYLQGTGMLWYGKSPNPWGSIGLPLYWPPDGSTQGHFPTRTEYPEITLRHMHSIAEPLTLTKYKDLVYSSKIPGHDLGRGTISHSRGDSCQLLALSAPTNKKEAQYLEGLVDYWSSHINHKRTWWHLSRSCWVSCPVQRVLPDSDCIWYFLGGWPSHSYMLHWLRPRFLVLQGYICFLFGYLQHIAYRLDLMHCCIWTPTLHEWNAFLNVNSLLLKLGETGASVGKGAGFTVQGYFSMIMVSFCSTFFSTITQGSCQGTLFILLLRTLWAVIPTVYVIQLEMLYITFSSFCWFYLLFFSFLFHLFPFLSLLFPAFCLVWV